MHARIAALALLLALSAPLRAGSLLERAPADQDVYVSVDFAALARSPHLPDLLGFLEKGLKVPVFGLKADSGVVFGETVTKGLVIVHKGAARVTLLEGKADAAGLRAKLKALADKAAADALAAGEAARAKEAEAAKAEKREPRAITDAPPRFVFDEIELGGKPALGAPGGIRLLVVDEGLIAAGKEADLKDALPALEGKGARASGSKALAGYLQRADTGRPVWWVSVTPARLKEKARAKNDQTTAKLQAVVGALTLTDDATLAARVLTEDEATATAFAERVNRRLSEAKGKFLVKTLGVAAMMEGIQVEPAGPEVSIRHSLKKDQVSVLLRVGAQLLGLFKK